MLQFELIDANRTPTSSPRIISIPDTAHGADMYLALKRKGFQLRRRAVEVASDDLLGSGRTEASRPG